ncbi:MAG: Uma2 family endonuclease [Anaerolineae bacterium]
MRLYLNRLESEEIIEKVDGMYRLTARWADIAEALRVIPVKLTYRDYMTWPDDGRRYELYEGEAYMVPSPSVKHQRISRKLMLLLAQFVDEYQLGEIFDAPLDVVFSESTVVQPDILFISHQRRDIIGEQNVSGAPDLVIEILSPSTEERDRGIKSQLYCRYGVREYWLVDPEERAVEVLALSPEGYQVLGQYGEDEVVRSQVLAGFQFSAKEIFGNG